MTIVSWIVNQIQMNKNEYHQMIMKISYNIISVNIRVNISEKEFFNLILQLLIGYNLSKSLFDRLKYMKTIPETRTLKSN